MSPAPPDRLASWVGKGLHISDPKALEAQINQITDVVTNGLFALRPANVILLGTQQGVEKRV